MELVQKVGQTEKFILMTISAACNCVYLLILKSNLTPELNPWYLLLVVPPILALLTWFDLLDQNKERVWIGHYRSIVAISFFAMVAALFWLGFYVL